MKIVKGILFLLLTALIIMSGVVIPDMLLKRMTDDTTGIDRQVDVMNMQMFGDEYLKNEASLKGSLDAYAEMQKGDVQVRGFIGISSFLYDNYSKARERMMRMLRGWNETYSAYIYSNETREYYITETGARLFHLEFCSMDSEVTGSLFFDVVNGMPVDLEYRLGYMPADKEIPDIKWDAFVEEYSIMSSIAFTVYPDECYTKDGVSYYVAKNYDGTLRLSCTVMHGNYPTVRFCLSY